MTRTIKFRAWDGKKIIEPKVKVEDGDSAIYLDDLNFWEKEYGYKLMQFTGLLDKNGKGMYEGDVVRLYSNDELRHEGIIEYIAPKFFVMDGDKSGLILTDKYEVIGNIYEDPNLIK